MRAMMVFVLLAAFINGLLPEGRARFGVRLITGLYALGMVADAIREAIKILTGAVAG